MPKADVSTNAVKVEFSNQGPPAAYYAVNESGFDRNPPAAARRLAQIAADGMKARVCSAPKPPS